MIFDSLSLKQLRKVSLWMNAFITIAILVGTLLPTDTRLVRGAFEFDKIAHFLMFAGWTFFFGLSLVTRFQTSLWKIFLFGCSFGLITEALQFVLPTNRSAELLDLIADILGSLIAVLFIRYILKRHKLPGLDEMA